MEQYISKSALVAEIKRLTKKNELYLDENAQDSIRFQKTGAYSVLCDLRHFINTLEVKEVPIWEKVSPDTGQTTLYKDEDKSYLERFGYRIDLKELDKLPKKNLKAQKGEKV